MPSHAEFIANICQHPTLMGPRLVYSDWLEERGDVRAEFIRLAIELAEQNFPPLFDVSYDLTKILADKLDLTALQQDSTTTSERYEQAERYVYLRTRLAELLTPARRHEWTMAGLPENEWYWNGGTVLPCKRGNGEFKLTGNALYFDFTRGFPEVVTCRFEDWQAHYRTLIGAMPVREVRLTTEPNGQWLLGHSNNNILTNEYLLQLLAAEFPGHDTANPITYTLPARQAEYVMDGFVQTEIGQFRPIEPPFITDPV